VSLFPEPLFVLDTETTGFPGQSHTRVIEFAGVLLSEDGVIIESYSSLICPDVLDERAAGALKVNKIEADDLRCAYPTVVVSDRIWDLYLSWGSPLVTSYNVRFDRAMCDLMCLSSFRWGNCIMLEAQKDLGLPKWPKLAAAAELYGIEVVGDPHRALTDAVTAAKIVVAMESK